MDGVGPGTMSSHMLGGSERGEDQPVEVAPHPAQLPNSVFVDEPSPKMRLCSRPGTELISPRPS